MTIIREIFSDYEAALEYARNEHGRLYALEDGTFKVVVIWEDDEWD